MPGSCAIYGAEAAGGVILVTTKRGAAAKPANTRDATAYATRLQE